MKKCRVAIASLLLASAAGCKGWGIAFVDRNSEPLVPDSGEGYLMFDLQPLANGGGAQRYDCTFKGEGKASHFEFEVVSKAPTGDPPISFTSGKIIAVPGSDASVFLKKLQKTLEAKTFPTNVQRVPELPFNAAILGVNNSHGKDGGFFTNPPGHWTAMKIFIGKDDAAEVFLNFNAALHKGEFSIKDADYGDDVLKELAKVL